MRREVRILRKNVYDFLHTTVLPKAEPPVLEIGPMQYKWTPVKKYFVDTRKFFHCKGYSYAACDVDPASGSEVLCSVLDLEQHLPRQSFGSVIALEVLEHVGPVWKVPEIFWNLLKPGGQLFLSVPYYFYRHAPFPDYWRISQDGLNLLFGPRFDVQISPLILRDERQPIQYTAVCRKKRQ